MIGTVKRIVRDKGFGFIRIGDGNEYFFHRSECSGFDGLTEGDKVDFQPSKSPKGLRGVNVAKVTQDA